MKNNEVSFKQQYLKLERKHQELQTKCNQMSDDHLKTFSRFTSMRGRIQGIVSDYKHVKDNPDVEIIVKALQEILDDYKVKTL